MYSFVAMVYHFTSLLYSVSFGIHAHSEYEYIYLGDVLYIFSSLEFDCRSSLTSDTPLLSLHAASHG